MKKNSSFRNKIHMVLGLLGIIPYLLAVYTFIQEGMGITQGVLFVAGIVFFFHLVGFQILRRYSDELLRLIEDTNQAISQKSYQPLPVDHHTTVEMIDLSSHFNMLISELEESRKQFNKVTVDLMTMARKDIRNYRNNIAEGELRQDRLKAYVGDNVMKQLLQQEGSSDSMQGKSCYLTTLFSDIRSFTAISEKINPEQVVSMLNEYFDAMVQIIHRHNGFLDKFIGDELMAVFGLDTSPQEGAESCVNAALEMQAATHRIMKTWERNGKPLFKVGMGANSGNTIIGNIGSADRMNYTVIGDSVNIASRLVQQAGESEVLISGSTFALCQNGYIVDRRGFIKVKNRENPIECYKVIGKKISLDSALTFTT